MTTTTTTSATERRAGRQADGSVGFYAYAYGRAWEQIWVRMRDHKTVERVPTGITYRTAKIADADVGRLNALAVQG